MGCGGSKADKSRSNLEFTITTRTLEEFIELEKEIGLYEKRHIVETLQVRKDQMVQLVANLSLMEYEHNKVTKQVKSDAGNRVKPEKTVKSYVMEQKRYDELAAFEHAEHLAALNKQEILKKELDGTKHHIEELKQEIEVLEDDMKDLQELYDREDKLLDDIFDGKYGSALENQLEVELDELEVQKQVIEETNFKWRQAQVMVEYACRQLGTAVEKWQKIAKMPSNNLEARYKVAEETRNNLIAAGQNLQGAHRYLPHITFPYCTPEEVGMLSKATSYVFTDMAAPQRQKHAMAAYESAHRRCAALLQWFNETINDTIKKDLDSAKSKVKKTSRALRRERLELIKQRVKDQHGKNINIDTDYDYDSETDMNNSSEKIRTESGRSVALRGSTTELRYSSVANAPSPLPLEDLAPLPTRDQLYGKTKEVTSGHNRNLNRMNSESLRSRARIHRDLQGKLDKRREYRNELQNHFDQVDGTRIKSQNHVSGTRRPASKFISAADGEMESLDGEEIMRNIVKRANRYT